MCSEAVLQKCSPRKMLRKHEANLQESNHAEERSQQSCFPTLLKPHPGIDGPRRNRGKPAEHLSPAEHLWGSGSICQKSFKRLI